MADRYWVGGTGTWGTTTTNWAATSGGASGASVPTAADNVFFDANSNTGVGSFTVTMTTTPRVCRNFTASGLDGTMTLAGTASIELHVSGSLFFPTTNFTRSYSGRTVFNATTTGNTITQNGKTFGNTTLDGVGGEWTLGSAFSCGTTGTLTLTNGTFDTSVSNYAVTLGSFSSSNSNIRTINLNGSTLTLALTQWAMTTSTNATLNAGTSTINMSGSLPTFAGGGLTYYDLGFTNTSFTGSMTGANTFRDLSLTGRTSVGVGVLTFSANQTISGTFTVSAGTTSVYRTFIASDTIGTTRTLTCAAVSLTDTDFRDITIAGAASPASGTRLGDCKGNSGITFPAAKTVYYRQTGSANWGATGSGSWSATSGGALDATQFPLAQDTAVFPAATYPASGSTTTINANYNIGAIDMSLRTSNTMTLGVSSNTPIIYDNWINGTGITLSGTGVITFSGRGSQTITSAGISFTSININTPSGSVTLQDALTIGTTSTTTLTLGTLDLNNLTLSTGSFSSANPNARTFAFGTGHMDLTGTGSIYNLTAAGNFTTSGTPVVNVVSTGSTAITVNSGNNAENTGTATVSWNFTGGTYALTFLATTTYNAKNVDFTGFAGTWTAIGNNSTIYGNLTLSSGMTLTASTNTVIFGATSGTQLITTNAKTLNFPITFQGTGGTRQLQDAMTLGSTRTFTFTSGTLDLNNLTLTTGLFASTGSTVKTIAFGTGKIDVTGTTGTVYQQTQTRPLVTGTSQVNITNSGATAISINFGSSIDANQMNFNITGGTYVLSVSTTSKAGNLNFTGFAGTLAIGAQELAVYGDLTLSTGMAITSSVGGQLNFNAESGTKLITTNGITIDCDLTISPFYGTTQLQDDLIVGSTKTISLFGGTLDLNGKTITAPVSFSISTFLYSVNLTFNGGTIVCSGAGAAFAFGLLNNPFTTTVGTGTGKISMTSASAKSFSGLGNVYNCTLEQAGAGALTIDGGNSFLDITNTVQPTTITFTSGTTTTFVNGFSLSGTVGNLVTINADSASQATLSKSTGTVSVSYLSIAKSNATGGAVWEAFIANGNVDGGGNSGWIGLSVPGGGNFLMFF